MECDDIQGETAGRNACSLRKENHKVSVQLQLVLVITISHCKHGARTL